MVVVSINGIDRYYDGYLVTNLDALKEAVYDNWDGVILITGREGSGKTTNACQCCLYLDNSFSIDNIAWTGQQFIDLVQKAPKYTAILLDEAYLIFATQSAAAELQKIIISMLTMIRSKNLFIFIVSPSPFDLKKYLVVHRSFALLNCYAVKEYVNEERTKAKLSRGRWALYGYEKKRSLYIKGKKENDFSVEYPDKTGVFLDWFPIDKIEYEKRKQEAINTIKNDVMNQKNSDIINKKGVMTGESHCISWLNRNQWLRSGAITAYAKYKGLSRDGLQKRMIRYEYMTDSLVNEADNATRSINKYLLQKEQDEVEE